MFLSHSANLGCSKCYSNFGTGLFGKKIIRDLIELIGCYPQIKSTEKMSELLLRVLQSRKENVKVSVFLFTAIALF